MQRKNALTSKLGTDSSEGDGIVGTNVSLLSKHKFAHCYSLSTFSITNSTNLLWKDHALELTLFQLDPQ